MAPMASPAAMRRALKRNSLIRRSGTPRRGGISAAPKRTRPGERHEAAKQSCECTQETKGNARHDMQKPELKFHAQTRIEGPITKLSLTISAPSPAFSCLALGTLTQLTGLQARGRKLL